MSDHEDPPGLGDALHRAAGDGTSAYTAADVAATARFRRRRRAAIGGTAVVAVVAGLAFGLTGGDEPSTLDTVGPPSTTTTLGSNEDPTTSTTPVDPSVECAAPLDDRRPLPDAERAAVVVDLDGDGAGDPFFFAPDEELGGSWIQADRSTDGASTTPIRLDGIFGRETFIDAADLDGDGRNEAFLELAGNTLLTGIIVEIEGCELRAITTDDAAFDDGDGLFTYPIASGGNGCAPTGCITSVVCTTGSAGGVALEIVTTHPLVSALDPGFDPDDPTPRSEREVGVDYAAFVIVDGAASPAPAQGLHPPDVTTPTLAGDPALLPWSRLGGVHCDRLTTPGAECDVLPTVTESDEWKVVGQSFVPGAPTQWAAFVRADGARIVLSSPGAIPAGDGDLGDLTLPWATARLGATGSNVHVGPYYLQWDTRGEGPLAPCTHWSASTGDIGPVSFADFAREVLGATDVEWFGAEPLPFLDGPALVATADDYLAEILEWGADGATPDIPPAFNPELLVDRVLVDAPQVDELWRQLFAGVTAGLPEVLRTESAPSNWDIMIGYDESCGLVDPTNRHGIVHQLTYTLAGAGTGDGCGLADLAIHLYLHADGTLAAVNVDTVTG